MQRWVENLLRQNIVALDDQPRRPHEWAGNVYRALAFGDLFWPDVHVVRGRAFIVLGDNSDLQELERSIDRAAGAGQDALEAETGARSLFEVPDFFAEAENPLDPDLDVAYAELAEVLRRAWTARLAEVLPSSSFLVSVRAQTDVTGVSLVVQQSQAR